MRFKFAALVLATFVLGACTTTPDESASTSGTGAATAPPAQTSSAPASSAVSSQPLSGGVQPGSPEDLAVNVGDRVLFGFDRFDLTSEARGTLEKQAAWFQRYPNGRITISGHADERGTREYNLALGDRRATAVKNYLVALGIQAGRIKTISYGKERPVDPRSTPEAWARNRRAVSTVDSASASVTN
jgi:peptidoglycan-associated lipoprotein